MIKKFRRLRGKKGFTIIELIVVIGIIGVLTAIILATMAYDARPTVGKGLAKDLFYVTQDAATSVKVAHPHAFDDYPTGSCGGVFIEVDENGNIGTIQTINVSITAGSLLATVKYEDVLDPDNPFEIAANPKDDTAIKANDKKAYQNAMAHAIKEYMTTKDCYKGCYYVVIDKNFRVRQSYWTSEPEAIKGGQNVLSNDCTLQSGELLCSYPTSFCDKGCIMFIM
jgi:prepilin-type N-terminal cleavage/methylation domain-containing protein